jgi:lipid-A-disaccharide synthase
MKYYIIAGEASGDLHGSNLLKEIYKLDPAASIKCWGGDMMEATGATLVKHYRQLAFMGFLEVIKNLPTILNNLAFCKKDIESFKPDVLVLIDYPGFNLRIANWGKEKGLKVAFYISPQVWAWKANRVKKMKQSIDLMMVILPFETGYYAEKWQWPVVYVGHPLVPVIDTYKPKPLLTETSKPIVAVLPGSRKQEIQVKLPEMLKVCVDFPTHHFVVAKAPSIEDDFYAPILAPYNNVTAVKGRTYDVLSQASAAVVTSGTATLETALFKVPEVVCYKGSNMSYQIARRLIKIKYISLVNLIMDQPVVKELIQQDMTSKNISHELNRLLFDEEYNRRMKLDYQVLHSLLSSDGNPSEKAAKLILKLASANAST